jgi:hypothetical protein
MCLFFMWILTLEAVVTAGFSSNETQESLLFRLCAVFVWRRNCRTSTAHQFTDIPAFLILGVCILLHVWDQGESVFH